MGALQDRALTRVRLCSYMVPVIVAKSNRQLTIRIKQCIVPMPKWPLSEIIVSFIEAPDEL